MYYRYSRIKQRTMCAFCGTIFQTHRIQIKHQQQIRQNFAICLAVKQIVVHNTAIGWYWLHEWRSLASQSAWARSARCAHGSPLNIRISHPWAWANKKLTNANKQRIKRKHVENRSDHLSAHRRSLASIGVLLLAVRSFL